MLARASDGITGRTGQRKRKIIKMTTPAAQETAIKQKTKVARTKKKVLESLGMTWIVSRLFLNTELRGVQ